MLGVTSRRSFATTGAADGNPPRDKSFEYQTYDEDIYYTPIRKVNFVDGKSTIFHQDTSPNQIKFVPWEIKETTLKNFLGVFGFVALDYLFHPGALIYSIGTMSFGFNWIYRVYSYLGYAITKIDLHEDGRTVTVTFKTGGSTTLKVKDIHKKAHEKELVQTFEEGFLFPVEVPTGENKKLTYYIYGASHEAVKNGEVFRAIINGQSIKL